jgi:hypothetical protein
MFCNSPDHEQWLLHVAVLAGRCLKALAAIVIALILQSQKPEIRSPLTGSYADHSAVQASGIEKSIEGGNVQAEPQRRQNTSLR